MCSNSTILSYILFMLSCTMLQFVFLCSLFGLFYCSDTNTPHPCSTDIIDGSHRFPPPAAPQDPMVALPFQLPALNRPSDRNSLYPSVPPNLSNLPSLPLQSIFQTTCQALWDSPIFFIRLTAPSNPFSNWHAKPCDPVPSFLNRLPAPPSHFLTDTPSAVS